MHDLITLGEVLLRLAVPSPARFESARALDVQIGGAEANVAAACARLGLRTAWISALPDNPWGERVRRELTSHGVDCAYVKILPGTRLGVYFLEYGVAPRPVHVLYDRRDSAFSHLTADAIDWEPVRRARLVHVSGITPALGRQARMLVERIFDEATAVSFDINYRSTLWAPAEARAFAEAVLPRARFVFLGRTEAHTVFGLDGGAEDILNALAYVGGYLWATLGGRTSQEVVNIAATVAALKCSTWGDVALISARDVDDAIAGGPDIRR